MLRKNQIEAIEVSKNNDYSSGIHYHATGSGKSWIAMHILKNFNEKYKKSNVLWLCERKDILNHQFSIDILKERKLNKILKNFIVLDFVKKKNKHWYNSLNNCIFWGKPYLCIINRCFLTNKTKYQLLNSRIDLVIHDECHSIENKTTQEFYKWLIENNKNKYKIDTRIIGFSATPEFISPLSNILSKYSIYDAFKDDIILPPKIVWVKSENKPKKLDIVNIIKKQLENQPYKKIIVWCGIIDECISLANDWFNFFKDYKICLDFNNIKTKTLNKKFSNYNDFYKLKSKGILFCAVKHREGSDIPNLDTCIFMDLVEMRSPRVFIQSMGRVLRLDKERKKKYGLIIDLNAKSSLSICNRVQYYLKLEKIFPWNYSIEKVTLNNTYYINTLDMIKIVKKKKLLIKDDKEYTQNDIKKYFIKQIPNNIKYIERLNHELNLLNEKKLFPNILKALEILKITKDIPHITRGSCGSSLVCYLLGISHVDPIKYNISFARFLNKYRDNLPDIDFDFPHYLRDEVFLKLYQKWGDCVARISNHNYYHEKSALRESLRRNGINKFISKYDLNREIQSYDIELKKKIFDTKNQLEGTFKGHSLHCGGIIYYPNGIPKEDIHKTKNYTSIIKQVKLNKIDVSNNKNFKIDILSSRGLTQLYFCRSFQSIDFDQHLGDPKTIKLLCTGNNIGITLAETPLMRKALLLIKPKSIKDLAICLAIIRPAAKEAKLDFELNRYNKENIIFDDDVIQIISKLVGCDEELADKLRRGYTKTKNNIVEKFIKRKPTHIQIKIHKILDNLRKYGFCKAHALSYAQLVWQLAYEKAHNPKKFWKSTLKNVNSCYRKWVHIYEARCHNVSHNSKEKSIYAQKRNKNFNKTLNPILQLKQFGYWIMNTDNFYPNCYFFKDIKNNYYHFYGIIASSRLISFKKKIIFFVGIEKQKYIEIIVCGNIYYNTKNVIIKGKGLQTNTKYNTISCKNTDINFI